MGDSEFLRELSIDRAGTLLLPREDAVCDWPLSSSTSIVSKMNLSKPLPPLPPIHPHCSLNSKKRLTRIAPCPLYFNQQDRLSTFPESSDLDMVEHSPNWSGSDITVEDHHHSEAELWDSYFWPQDKYNQRSHFHQFDQTANSPVRKQGTNLSPCNLNFASTNFSALNINEGPANLRRSDAIRTHRCTLKSTPHNTYSPFPTVSPPPTPTYESANKSLPLRCDSRTQPRRPALRSRVLQQPNLSTCSTLDDLCSPSHSSTSSASGLCMRSVPASPNFTPPVLKDLMEKSYFEDDSDGEDSKLSRLATKLHIRGASSNSPSPCGTKDRTLRNQKSRRSLKSAGDAFMGIFAEQQSASIS